MISTISPDDATRILAATSRIWPPGPNFRIDALQVLHELVGADLVQFHRMDIAAGKRDFVVYPLDWSDRVGAIKPVLDRLRNQHPVVAFYAGAGELSVMRVSDRVGPDEWYASQLYREYFIPLGVDWEMLVPVPSGDRFLNLISLMRSGEDFTERDVAVCNALLPALALGCGGAPEPGEMRSGAIGGWFAVTIDGADRVIQVAPPDPSGTLREGLRLPSSVRRAEGSVGLPPVRRCRIDDEDWISRSVMATSQGELIGMRRTTSAPADLAALTGRQLDVLQLVAGGRRNAEIARELGIAEGTVRKHLENILEALDVPNRAGAAARWHALSAELAGGGSAG